MPLYTDVVAATRDTLDKLLAHRGRPASMVQLDCAGGDSASMERAHGGKTLVLHMPSFAPDLEMSRAEADRCVGYLVHEVAHWLHTDWSQWTAAARGGGWVREMTNALEDLRIERVEQAAGVWKGFGAAMATLINHFDLEAQTKPRQRPIGSIAADLPWLVALIGRAECNGLDIPGAARARAAAHPSLRPILEEALRGASKTQSCSDCHTLARKLARKLAKATPPPPPPPPPPPTQGQDKGQSQGQEGQGEGQDSPDSQDSAQGPEKGQGGQGEGQDSPDSQDSAQGQEEGQGTGQGQGEEEEESTSTGQDQGQGAGLGVTEAKTEAWQNTTPDSDTPSADFGPDLPAHETTGFLATQMTERPRFRVNPCPWAIADTHAAKQRRDALPRSARLHDQVGQLVAAQEVRQMERRLTTGRFDRRAVARAAMGATDVCAHRHVTPGCNTAVCLLLDLSGSMNGKKIQAAQTMAMHLSEAVDMAGGHSAVLGFGDVANHKDLNDNHGCQLILFKDWPETPALGARRIASASTPFGTPLSPSIIAAARWMRGTIEADRYVLGVLTDGDCGFGVQAVQAACRTALRLGVDLFALGCLHDTSKSFRGFPRADVQRVADLPRVAMRTLLAELERRT